MGAWIGGAAATGGGGGTGTGAGAVIGAWVTAGCGCAFGTGGRGIAGRGLTNGGIWTCGAPGLEACLLGAFRENWLCTQPDNATTAKATIHGAQNL